MGRVWRIEYEGTLSHLMSRGNDGHLFTMSYSAISHSFKIFEEKMNNDKKVISHFEIIDSQFKL